jgi:hypothetical protein
MSESLPSSTVKDASALSPNQVKALNALLSTTTIPAAAQACGLHVTTIKKYLAQDEFSAVYRKQRMLILEETIAGLTLLGTKAVGVIEGALDDTDDPNAQLRAARTALDFIAKLVELERRIRDQDELEDRIAELEDAEARRQQSENRRARGYRGA